MEEKYNLSEDQTDALQELMNVSFGLASSLISDSLKSFSKMPLPVIDSMEISKLKDYILNKFDGNSEYLVTSQIFRNKFDGESIFILDERSAKIITSLLLEEDVEKVEEADVKSSVLELTNIISSACVGKLLELLDAQIFFQPPMVDFDAGLKQAIDKMSESSEDKDYKSVIIIETSLVFEKEKIEGYLFILTKESSFEWLKNALDDFIENYE
ncbi:MAG: chemotaxis protein CheX [Campylobacterales bacterium]|nr:chemotaxis protein CheX [Campylobacterales bacterium]